MTYVYDDVKIYGNAMVFGYVQISDEAKVGGHAVINGDTKIPRV